MKNKEYANLGELLQKAGLGHKLSNRPSPVDRLSTRETQILVSIASGTAPADAARLLQIAVKSFSTYRARVLEKLGLHSNAELAILAFELGLVPSVLKRLTERDDGQDT